MLNERARILLVDDEESVHKAISLTLRRDPYDLVYAPDAATALHVLESDPSIACVVCDHNMPGTRGVDFLSKVRERFPDVATMLLTGEADLELAMRAINEAGVQALLSKPWDPSELRAVLRGLVSRKCELIGPEHAESVERSLRREMAPAQDPVTGVYYIDND